MISNSDKLTELINFGLLGITAESNSNLSKTGGHLMAPPPGLSNTSSEGFYSSSSPSKSSSTNENYVSPNQYTTTTTTKTRRVQLNSGSSGSGNGSGGQLNSNRDSSGTSRV